MKILVSDFDDTLYFAKYTDDDVSKQIDAVDSWQEDGNLFVINTGRSFFNIKYLLEKYDFSFDYLICANGAAIYDEEFNLLFAKEIDNEVRDEVLKVLHKYNRGNQILTANDIFESSVILDYPVAIFQRYYNLDIAKKTQTMLDKLKTVDHYLSTNYICINHIEVNKSYAIKKLIDIENLNYKKVYTIGDSYNDIPMLKDFDGYKIGNRKELDFVKREFKDIKEFIDVIKKEG